MTLAIGSVAVSREQPRLVASVAFENCLADARAAVAAGADIIEVRVDYFAGLDTADGERAAVETVKRLSEAGGAPLIVTVRSTREGGLYAGDEEARAQLYEQLLPFAGAVDIELRSKDVHDRILPLARRLRAPLILSYHEFAQTPGDDALQALIDEGFNAGAGFVKLALTPRDQADVVRLLALTERNAARHVVIIAMGELGRVSRLMFPHFGSRLTYSHAGVKVAPGQLGVAEVRSVMRLLG